MGCTILAGHHFLERVNHGGVKECGAWRETTIQNRVAGLGEEVTFSQRPEEGKGWGQIKEGPQPLDTLPFEGWPVVPPLGSSYTQ